MSSAIIKSEQELQCTCLLEWNCRDRESWRCWWFWGKIKQILAVCDDCCCTSHVAQISAASGYTSETNLLHFEQSSNEKKIKGYALCSGNCNKKQIETKPEQISKIWARQNLHRSYETKNIRCWSVAVNLACTWHQAMITEAMAMADAVNSSSFLYTQFSRQTECTTTMKTVLQKHRIDLWLCCWALRKLWRYALAEQIKGGPTLLQWSMIRASNLPAKYYMSAATGRK